MLYRIPQIAQQAVQGGISVTTDSNERFAYTKRWTIIQGIFFATTVLTTIVKYFLFVFVSLFKLPFIACRIFSLFPTFSLYIPLASLFLPVSSFIFIYIPSFPSYFRIFPASPPFQTLPFFKSLLHQSSSILLISYLATYFLTLLLLLFFFSRPVSPAPFYCLPPSP